MRHSFLDEQLDESVEGIDSSGINGGGVGSDVGS